jgi:hypothetical protein
MWSKICQIIPTLARLSNPSRLLAELEVLLCSGLESRHRSIVNSSIRIWSSTFGASKVYLAYPANLKAVLLRIHRVTELPLPFFPESLESDGMIEQRQLPNFAATQGDASNSFGSAGIDFALRVEPTPRFGISPASAARLKNYTPQVLTEIAQSVPPKRSRESTPDSTKRKSRQRNVAPKLRHDDSQVQFEAIESSPINGAVLDLQQLTDRQKEVKERQQAEAAMFPDLRSSPKQKDKSRSSPNSELPLHRSASKSRGETSPSRERETTPTLAPQVDYDDYINSSPTPTRALHKDGNMSEPPSSPPEAPKEQTISYGEDEMDVPSSPPEMPQVMEMDTTISFIPSAQVGAGEKITTLSTFESTSPHQESSIMADATPPESPKSAVFDEISIVEAAIAQSTLVPERTETHDLESVAPGSPSCGRESSPAAFQTPRSELFHDAQTSPALSDKNTANEDIFEDAVSSPRLDLNKVDKQQPSSPITYLDESSAMRMMANYDQGSGHPRRSPRNVRFTTNQENETEPASPSTSTSRALPQQTTSQVSDQLPEFHGAYGIIKEPPFTSEKDVEASSPMPSLIPETPGSKAALNLRIVDGEEIDLNETIVVDDSILHKQDAPTVKRRKRKSDMTSDVASSSAPKKGKHREVMEESNQIPDHEDAKAESKSS